MFCVITSVPEPGDEANLAAELDLHFDQGGAIQKPHPGILLTARTPVFYLSEILVVDGDGREVSGKGRKPIKWGVGYEEFESIDDAVARAKEVREW